MYVNNLAGTYRVSNREVNAICEMRMHRSMRLSINQIARVFDRSTSTVHSFVRQLKYDNRRASPNIRTNRKIHFEFALPSLRVKMKLYIEGIFQTIEEALLCKTVPLTALEWFFATENTLNDEGDEPH